MEIEFLNSADLAHSACLVIARNISFDGICSTRPLKYRAKTARIELNAKNVDELVPEYDRIEGPYFHEGLFTGMSKEEMIPPPPPTNERSSFEIEGVLYSKDGPTDFFGTFNY